MPATCSAGDRLRPALKSGTWTVPLAMQDVQCSVAEHLRRGKGVATRG